MIIPKPDFIDAVKFLLPAIGENESRRNLMYLNCKKVGNNVVFTATNAFIIKRVIIPTTDKNFFPFMILRRDLKIFKSICSQVKYADYVDITSSTLVCCDLELKYKQTDIEFPNLEKLIGTEYQEQPLDNYVGLNHHFIQDCLSGFPCDEKGVVKVHFKSKEGPVKITSQDGKYIAMILPVRITW